MPNVPPSSHIPLQPIQSPTAPPPDMDAKIARRRHRIAMLVSYGPDWLITVVLACVFFALDNVDGFKREFSLTDTSLKYPFAVHERVPDFALQLIAILAPFLLQILINLTTIRSWWDFHNATLGLLLSLALTGSVTQFTKITVGRPRPDIISRCQPLPGSADPPLGLSGYQICTQTNEHILRDGFRSFPSGHSSISFAGLGFLSFYLAGKLHLFDHRGHAGKAWLSLTPLSGAALVAISRTMDYRHHWHDVLVGAVLGLVMAYFCYRQYYPSLATALSHRPYAPRHTLHPMHGLEHEDSRPLHGASSDDGEGDHDHGNGFGNGTEHYSDRMDPHARAELQGTVPRQGAQDLTATWQNGEGRGSTVESQNQV